MAEFAEPATGSVLYLSAEDDRDVVHRRLVAICNSHNIGLDALVDLHVLDLAGDDAVLASPRPLGLLKPTTLVSPVERMIAELRPALVVLSIPWPTSTAGTKTTGRLSANSSTCSAAGQSGTGPRCCS